MDIVIFEDEERIRTYLVQIIKNEQSICNIRLSTDSYKSVIEYARHAEQPALYLIDIVVENEIQGLALAKEIKLASSQNIIVFITGFPEHIMFNSEYKILAFNVLLKNKNMLKFELLETLEAAMVSFQSNVFVYKYSECCYKAILLDNIAYFEKLKNSHSVCIYQIDGGFVTINCSLKKTIKMLDERFMKCHSSFIVNVSKIVRIEKGRITLSNKMVCYYSRIHKRELLERMSTWKSR